MFFNPKSKPYKLLKCSFVGFDTFIFLLIDIFVSVLIGNKLSKPIEELEDIMKSIQIGDFTRDVPQKLKDRKDEMGSMANVLSDTVESLQEKENAAEKLSKGYFDINIKMISEKDTLSKSMIMLVETIRSLVAETKMLTDSSIEDKAKCT